MKERLDRVKCDSCGSMSSLTPSLTHFTNPTRDVSDLARDGIWSPRMMNAEADRHRSMRRMATNKGMGRKVTRFVELGDPYRSKPGSSASFITGGQ